MAWRDWSGRRKRRPREHMIGEIGVNFLERQILRRSRQLRRVAEPEYGADTLRRSATFDALRRLQNN